jgi:type IV secretory pathway TrbF-like protein
MSTAFRNTTIPVSIPRTVDKQVREKIIDNSLEQKRQRLIWQRATFACLFIIALQACIMAWISSQSKLIPYVVQVDKLGSTQAVGRADTLMTVNPSSIKAHLAKWIENTRSVYTDVAAEKKSSTKPTPRSMKKVQLKPS